MIMPILSRKTFATNSLKLNFLKDVWFHSPIVCSNVPLPCLLLIRMYHMRSIISRGLYILTHFSMRLILQTIYVLNKEIFQFLGLKYAVYNQEQVIMHYNGVCTVCEIHFKLCVGKKCQIATYFTKNFQRIPIKSEFQLTLPNVNRYLVDSCLQ